MMSGFSLAVCLAVLSTGRAGNVAPNTTLSPSVGKQLLQEFRSMKQTLTSQHDGLKGMLTSKQQLVPYSQRPSASRLELQAIQSRLNALDTKLEAKLESTQARLEAMQAKLESAEAKQAATQTKMKSTQTKMESTQTKLESTQTKLESTQTKLESTHTKLESTQTRLAATEAKQKAAGKVLRSAQATLRALQANLNSGSTYVRWGRKSCSNASQLVYSGIAGGSWYHHPGAAANPLCLTLTPQTDGTRVPPVYALLYGAEYETIPNHHEHDVPCSLCLAPQATTIMIPATHTCPNGWTAQYRGHLSAGHYNHKSASQFVCLDKDLENASGGHVNRDGRLFSLTVTRCGSLPCPPYGHNQVVLCVVCSK